jgi:hypothetical protein
MGKPESVIKKKEKTKPPVSKAAISELPGLPFTILVLPFAKSLASGEFAVYPP